MNPGCKVTPHTIFCMFVSDIVGFSVCVSIHVTPLVPTMFLLPPTSMQQKDLPWQCESQ